MDKKVALTVRYHLYRDETMECAEKAGFRYVCMGLGETDVFEHDDWETRMAELSRDLEKHHLRCVNVHLPVYDLRIPGDTTDPVTDRSILRCLKAAKMLGADVCAYHSRSRFVGGKYPGALDREHSLTDNLSALAPLVEEAEKQGVIVGVENLVPGFYPEYPDEMLDMIDHFHSDAICALWDTGHAHLFDFDHAAGIRKLGHRLKATHIHDNPKNYDAHNPPSMGTTDWNSVLHAFKQIGYNGYLTLESAYYHGPMTDLYIKHLYECICRLDDMFAAIEV